MKSKDLSQAKLPLHPRMIDVDLREVRRCTSMTAAIRLCVSLSGEQYDQSIYQDLNIDAGQWSRIMKNQSYFPHERYQELFDRCGNEAPLIWLADRRGYGLVRRETELEKENRELRDRVQELERRYETITEFMRESKTA